MRKSIIFLGSFVLLFGCIIRNNVFANQPVLLYDRVWSKVNSTFVDKTQNGQDWARWRHKYDDVIQTDEDAYVAIETMVTSLNDQYTRFLTPEENKDEDDSIKASLKGIGLQLGLKDGKLVVIAPIEDTPAEKAGLLAGDEILEIDGQSTKDLAIDKAAEKIRGPEGTQVTLLIKRKDHEPKRYVITRAKISLKAVSQKTPLETAIPNNLSYIRLNSFISQNAANEFGEVISSTDRDTKGYIIDLRSNPGGLLSNAISISDMFLSDGEAIVYTVDRDTYAQKESAKQVRYKTIYTTKPVVILINKGSASASEIFAGAMKDNARAVLVGEQSFGKGLVQQIFKLPDSTALHVTIQKYLTPNKTDINKKGITPDVVVEMTEENIKNKDDVQLKKAIEILTQLVENNVNTLEELYIKNANSNNMTKSY